MDARRRLANQLAVVAADGSLSVRAEHLRQVLPESTAGGQPEKWLRRLRNQLSGAVGDYVEVRAEHLRAALEQETAAAPVSESDSLKWLPFTPGTMPVSEDTLVMVRVDSPPRMLFGFWQRAGDLNWRGGTSIVDYAVKPTATLYGYTAHSGGNMPVEPGVMVHVVLRDGYVTGMQHPADTLSWRWAPRDLSQHDIVGWRIARGDAPGIPAGYTEHHGTLNPVSAEVLVDVITRRGRILRGYSSGTWSAWWRWGSTDPKDDVVAWQLSAKK